MATYLMIFLLTCLSLSVDKVQPALAKEGMITRRTTEQSIAELEKRIQILEECNACSKIAELQKSVDSKADTEACPCNSDYCGDNAVCRIPKPLTCKCKAGFTGNGSICVDVDECKASNSACDVNANCQNTVGSYTCSCKPGFTGDGKTCTDIDECASGLDDCHSKASCTNTAGSYTCSCNPPYTGNGKTCTLPAPVPAECKNYQTLNSANRKVTHGLSGWAVCDKNLGPGWFRFQGDAGTKMPTSCTPINRCQTSMTGWLNGAHPAEDDGVVTRKVCFHYWSNCCYTSTNIQVRNCGSFYVYYFDGTPFCNLRYCGTD